MSHLTVLVGFHYQHELPGIVVDLFRVYTMMARRSQVVVLTDIHPLDFQHPSLATGVTEGLYPATILDFVTELQRTGRYRYVATRADLAVLYASLALGHRTIYFTGHSRANGWVLPDGSVYLLESLLASCPQTWIFDCCHLKMRPLLRRLAHQRPVLCITSSEVYTHASNAGSLFTTHLLARLEAQATLSELRADPLMFVDSTSSVDAHGHVWLERLREEGGV